MLAIYLRHEGELRLRAEAKSNKTRFIDDRRVEEIEKLTRKVFGVPPDRVAFPGGESRSAFFVKISGVVYVIARRENLNDAAIEAIVLKTLSGTESIPKLIARQQHWIVQEFIDGPRLPIALDDSNESVCLDLAEEALTSLYQLHQAAKSEGLQHRVPRIGIRPGWQEARIGEPISISKSYDLNMPNINFEGIQSTLNVGFHDFIKWDSRPGNAILSNENVKWFDWEDCGRRCAVDDLVCFAQDEWLSLPNKSQLELVEKWIGHFSGSLSEDEAWIYFLAASIVHLSFRLSLIVNHKKERNGWWDREKCLQGDKVGVTKKEAELTCRRIYSLANTHPLLTPYKDWLSDILVPLGVDSERVFYEDN